MNNKEATKALLEGKTLRIINKSRKDITYKFNKEVLAIVTSEEDIYWNMQDFNKDCEWEEVKEPYTDSGTAEHLFITGSGDRYLLIPSPNNLGEKQKFNYTIKEIIE